jgi:hypothetical protein
MCPYQSDTKLKYVSLFTDIGWACSNKLRTLDPLLWAGAVKEALSGRDRGVRAGAAARVAVPDVAGWSGMAAQAGAGANLRLDPLVGPANPKRSVAVTGSDGTSSVNVFQGSERPAARTSTKAAIFKKIDGLVYPGRDGKKGTDTNEKWERFAKCAVGTHCCVSGYSRMSLLRHKSGVKREYDTLQSYQCVICQKTRASSLAMRPPVDNMKLFVPGEEGLSRGEPMKFYRGRKLLVWGDCEVGQLVDSEPCSTSSNRHVREGRCFSAISASARPRPAISAWWWRRTARCTSAAMACTAGWASATCSHSGG